MSANNLPGEITNEVRVNRSMHSIQYGPVKYASNFFDSTCIKKGAETEAVTESLC